MINSNKNLFRLNKNNNLIETKNPIQFEYDFKTFESCFLSASLKKRI